VGIYWYRRHSCPDSTAATARFIIALDLLVMALDLHNMNAVAFDTGSGRTYSNRWPAGDRTQIKRAKKMLQGSDLPHCPFEQNGINEPLSILDVFLDALNRSDLTLGLLE
jgi:hypothetical protein